MCAPGYLECLELYSSCKGVIAHVRSDLLGNAFVKQAHHKGLPASKLPSTNALPVCQTRIPLETPKEQQVSESCHEVCSPLLTRNKSWNNWPQFFITSRKTWDFFSLRLLCYWCLGCFVEPKCQGKEYFKKKIVTIVENNTISLENPVLLNPRSSTVTQLRQGSGALPTSVSGGYYMRGFTDLGIWCVFGGMEVGCSPEPSEKRSLLYLWELFCLEACVFWQA